MKGSDSQPKKAERKGSWACLVTPWTFVVLAMPLLMSCQDTWSGGKKNILPMPSEDSQLTGAAKIVEDPEFGDSELVPYTGSGHTAIITKMRSSMNQRLFSPELSRQLTGARVVIGSKTDGTPEKLQVSVGMRPPHGGVSRQLEFEVPLERRSDGHLGRSSVRTKSVEGSGDQGYQIDADCKDASCSKVEVVLKQENLGPQRRPEDKPQIQAETAFLFSKEETQARVKLPSKPKGTPEPLSEIDLDNPLVAVQESVEVLEGPSFVRVTIPGKDADHDILNIEGELLRTTDRTSDLQKATIGDKSYAGSLIGNDEEGDIAVRIKMSPEPEPDSKEGLRSESQPERERPEPQPEPQPQPQSVDKTTADENEGGDLTIFIEKPKARQTVPSRSDPRDMRPDSKDKRPGSKEQPGTPKPHEQGGPKNTDFKGPAQKGGLPQVQPAKPVKPAQPVKPPRPAQIQKPKIQSPQVPQPTRQIPADKKALPPPSPPSPLKPEDEKADLPIEQRETFQIVDKDIWASSPSAVVPVDFSDPKLRKAQRITRSLESLRNDSNVIKFMSYWTQENKYQRCGKGRSSNLKPIATQFFHRLKPLVPFTTPIFQALDTTPEVMYISALESKYAVNDGWAIESARCAKGQSCSTAAGPYQITEIAARYLRSVRQQALNFITLPLSSSRQVSPNDDRSKFLPSTFAMAAYAKDMMDWFPEHPELWPLGYTEGQGGLALSMKCSQEKTQAARTSCLRSSMAGKAFRNRDRYRSTTLDEIVRFKMAPCDKLDYVLMYHALRFVGANPNRFGMSLEESKIAKKLPPLYRQGQNSKNLVHTMLK